LARVGILGGTFDPPHNGHIAIARAALKELGLDKVVFIPARIPPHKTKRIIASPEDRFNMLRLAIDAYPDFEISRIELDRPGPSYTADTLERLRAIDPETELVLLIGTDNVSEIEGWHEPERIATLATLAAANRPGFNPGGKYADRVVYFDMPPMDISSTEVRNRIRADMPITDLVPPEVESYIIKRRLYISNE
jgi:nicotinate-nucleotide adenylyltransferase